MHAGQLTKHLAGSPQVAAPARYRLIGQLLEIVTVGEALRKQGYVCEVRVKDLPEFGSRDSQETIRAVVGENVYASQVAGCPGHLPVRGAAVSLCLGVILLNDAAIALELFEIQVLTAGEIGRLHSFAQSTVGAQFLQ